MKLSLIKPYLSLVDLPEQDLPDFTIITGLNGAGKSHLLKALHNGSATADFITSFQNDIKLFDWSSLAPVAEGAFGSEIIRQERVNAYNQLKNFQDQPWAIQQVFTNAKDAGIVGPLLTDIHALINATELDLERFATDHKKSISLKETIEQAVTAATANVMNHTNQELHELIRSVEKNSKRSILALRETDFLRIDKPVWGKSEFLQQSFARLFVTYRDLFAYNRLAQSGKIDGDTDAEAIALTDAEFLKNYGIPPWDFVNESLRNAGMSFTINKPELYTLNPFKPILRKAGINTEILFSGLSSGERIIMSFAFAVYYANDSRQMISRPKLLLLDEVDAPLHPSMCRSLISTIQNVIVNKLGLKVIMTTHSPSTVAIAPESTIHMMIPGVPGITKTTKDAALRDLTSGVPTLSLFYDGRRQVFVESPRDVDVYQFAFEALKRVLSSELSLNFIATGTETTEGEHRNTGCDIVKKIVLEIRKAGARHTFGLIDWDNSNTCDDGIFVLAEGERNGLESVLFDPLLIVNLLIHQFSSSSYPFGLPKDTTFTSLGSVDISDLQSAVDYVQQIVLGRASDKSSKTEYVGGFELLIDKQYYLMDDHDLDKKLNKAFPELRSISKQRTGLLSKWIAQMILSERPQHCPLCLLNTFQKIVEN